MTVAFVLVVALIAALLTLRAPRRALAVAVFLVPWNGLSVQIGVGVTPDLVFSALLLGFVLVRLLARRSRSGVSRSVGMLGYVVAYAVLWSLILIPFLPSANVAGGAMRGPEARAIGQIVVFLIVVSPVLIVPLITTNLGEIVGLARSYLISVSILAAIGWLQILVWVTTGSDPLPVEFFNHLLGGAGQEMRSGMFEFQGGLIYRMSSLGGEPKDLGSSLVVGLLLVQAGLRPQGVRGKLLWPFLFGSMVVTFSTTALVGWFGATLVQLATNRQVRFSIPRISGHIRFKTLLGIPLVVMALGSIGMLGMGGGVVEMLESRTTARIAQSEDGALEDFNVAVVGFLRDQPAWAITGTGLGNAHLHADPYLPSYAASYAGGKIFVAKSGGLRWISELGLLSLLLFGYWILASVRRAVSTVYRSENGAPFAKVLAKTCFPLFALWLVAGQVTPHLFVLLGGVVAAELVAGRTLAPDPRLRGEIG